MEKEPRKKRPPPGNGPSERLRELRLLAQGRYITSSISVADLIKEEPFCRARLHRRTMELWCRQGEWVRLRLEIQAQTAEQVRQRFINDAATERVDELLRLKGIYDRAVCKLEGDDVSVRSCEGLMAAVVRMDAHLNEQRELVAAKQKVAKEQVRPGAGMEVVKIAGVDYNRCIAPKFSAEQEHELRRAQYEKHLVDRAEELGGTKRAEAVASKLAALKN